MNPAYAIAASVPADHRAEVLVSLEQLAACYPTDRGPQAKALREVVAELRRLTG